MPRVTRLRSTGRYSKRKQKPQQAMSPRQRERQRQLRMNATPSETALLEMLRHHPATNGRFEFQACVCGYYPDFAFHAAKLIVELDGACHLGPREQRADARRTAKLERAGWRVIRFWNGELREPLAVMERILMHLASRAPRQQAQAQTQAIGRPELAC